MGFSITMHRAGVLGVIIAFAVIVQNLSILNAQTPNDSVTLGVSPQLLDLTANPGETLTNTFRLTNASAQQINVKTIPKNFTPRGEEGAVDLTEDKTSFSLAEWITVEPETAVIGSSETKDFLVSINVPSNVEPGSHFGSVVFQTIPPEQPEAAALVSQEIAPVILVKVAGDVTETAEITEFISTKSFWSNESAVSLISRIKNTGSAHFKPTGQIVIKNMFGSEVAKLEIDKKNVLPGSIRQFTNDWQIDGLKLGRYTAELTIISGEDNKINTAKTSFTIFPYQIIFPIVLAVVILVFVLFKGRSRIIRAAKVLSGKDTEKLE